MLVPPLLTEREFTEWLEVFVDPQRIPRAAVGVPGEVPHHLPMTFDRYPHQIQPPALGNEQSESHTADFSA